METYRLIVVNGRLDVHGVPRRCTLRYNGFTFAAGVFLFCSFIYVKCTAPVALYMSVFTLPGLNALAVAPYLEPSSVAHTRVNPSSAAF
jgi:hypothetical protein